MCRGEKLWVPDDTESQRRNDFVNEHFPSTARLELFQMRRADRGNVLNPAAFDKFLAIHDRLLNISYANNGAYANLPSTVEYSTLCLNADSSEGTYASSHHFGMQLVSFGVSMQCEFCSYSHAELG